MMHQIKISLEDIPYDINIYSYYDDISRASLFSVSYEKKNVITYLDLDTSYWKVITIFSSYSSLPHMYVDLCIIDVGWTYLVRAKCPPPCPPCCVLCVLSRPPLLSSLYCLLTALTGSLQCRLQQPPAQPSLSYQHSPALSAVLLYSPADILLNILIFIS